MKRSVSLVSRIENVVGCLEELMRAASPEDRAYLLEQGGLSKYFDSTGSVLEGTRDEIRKNMRTLQPVFELVDQGPRVLDAVISRLSQQRVRDAAQMMGELARFLQVTGVSLNDHGSLEGFVRRAAQDPQMFVQNVVRDSDTLARAKVLKLSPEDWAAVSGAMQTALPERRAAGPLETNTVYAEEAGVVGDGPERHLARVRRARLAIQAMKEHAKREVASYEDPPEVEEGEYDDVEVFDEGAIEEDEYFDEDELEALHEAVAAMPAAEAPAADTSTYYFDNAVTWDEVLAELEELKVRSKFEAAGDEPHQSVLIERRIALIDEAMSAIGLKFAAEQRLQSKSGDLTAGECLEVSRATCAAEEAIEKIEDLMKLERDLRRGTPFVLHRGPSELHAKFEALYTQAAADTECIRLAAEVAFEVGEDQLNEFLENVRLATLRMHREAATSRQGQKTDI